MVLIFPEAATSDLPSFVISNPSTALYEELFSETTKISKLLQTEKAPPPMVNTLSGIVTLFKLLHPMNALAPIVSTPLGISTFVREVQRAKQESSMIVTEDGISTLVNAQSEKADVPILATALGM